MLLKHVGCFLCSLCEHPRSKAHLKKIKKKENTVPSDFFNLPMKRKKSPPLLTVSLKCKSCSPESSPAAIHASALRSSSRAQQQWHRLILEAQRGDRWLSQPSPRSLPSPNIPGTPPAVARRGPPKPLHSEVKRASTRASTHTHIDARYLG